MTSTTTPTAKFVRLGSSGLVISNPILGAMSFGDPKWLPWTLDAAAALPILKEAFDSGINTWDTSNNYSNGLSEKTIAEAIKKYKIPRAQIVIMTKCNFFVGDEGTPVNMVPADSIKTVNQKGLSRAAIFSAVDASLKRLDTEYIDLLQIHRFDPDTPPAETMQALNDLVRSGKVRYIGASSMWTWQFALLQHTAELHGWTKFVAMQNHYSLLYREEEREMIPYCKATGVGLIPWSPLARGHLARAPAEGSARKESEIIARGVFPVFGLGFGEVDQAIIARVQEVASKKGWSMAEVSLAWVNEKVSAPIVGLGSVKRVAEAAGAAEKRLDEEEVAYLEELYVPRAVMGH